MNIFKITGIAVCLSFFMTLNAATGIAAPKTKKPAKAVAPAATSFKWEYCYVVSGGYFEQGQGVAAYFPNGRQRFIPFQGDGYKAIAKMLNELGTQGWRVVAYQVGNEKNGNEKTWTFERRK